MAALAGMRPHTVAPAIRRIGAAVVLAVLGLLLLAACGGGGDEEAETPTGQPQATAGATEAPAGATEGPAVAVQIDPCALVTKEDAAQALGEPVGEPERNELPAFFFCTYNPAQAPITKALQVVVLKRTVSAEEFQSQVQASAEAGAVEPQPVADVGDDAFYVLGQLIVRKGDKYLSITVTLGIGGDEQTRAQLQAAALEPAKTAALKAIGRLP